MVVNVCTPTPGTVKAGALGLVIMVWPLAVPTNRAKLTPNKGRNNNSTPPAIRLAKPTSPAANKPTILRLIILIPCPEADARCPERVFTPMLTRYLLVHELPGHVSSSEDHIAYTNCTDNQRTAQRGAAGHACRWRQRIDNESSSSYVVQWRVRLRTIISVVASALLAAGALTAGQPSDIRPAGGCPKTIHVFDARCLRKLDLRDPRQAAEVWDTMHALAAVQGLANRETPKLYVLYCAGFGVETDQFWLDWLRGEDGWLKDSEMIKLTSLEEVVRAFRPFVKGLAVYDPEVPATSSLASTAAGCDDLLPVRFSRTTNSVDRKS